MKTTPPSVHTPITEAKPTAAEMLKGVCVTSSESTPPVSPKGSMANTKQRVAQGIESGEQQPRITSKLSGMTIARRRCSFCRLSYSPAHSMW